MPWSYHSCVIIVILNLQDTENDMEWVKVEIDARSHIVMAYMGMAYVVVPYIVMAYVVMAWTTTRP